MLLAHWTHGRRAEMHPKPSCHNQRLPPYLPVPLNKTISPVDLKLPEVRAQSAKLRRFVWGMFFRREPLAVNGVLRRRWHIRWHKLWEYTRGLAYVPWRPGWRVLDFGGGATLPVFYQI